MTHSTESSRCTYRDPAGRRCRLPRKPRHPAYCAHHARFSSEGVLEDPEQLTTDIFGTEVDFSDARALDRVAGKLLISFLPGRIPARRAAVAGYLCQLLIQTLPHVERQAEPTDADRHAYARAWLSNVPRPDYSHHFAKSNVPNDGSSEGTNQLEGGRK